jgi:hypothetical protein
VILLAAAGHLDLLQRLGVTVVIPEAAVLEIQRKGAADPTVQALALDQRGAVAGQTVLVVGNRGEGETFPWWYFKFWMLDTNLGRFEKV